ncbi:MAG TPA: hypothetical protein VKA84_19770 [Gemmatimonadaceae bacterium]|nr:hypothetical protein [Gemmatimonadaceae bacterium]
MALPFVRRRQAGPLAALAGLAGLAGVTLLAACSDDPAKPTGPVTIRFITIPYYNDPNPLPGDSARPTALVSIDNGTVMTVEAGDSVTNIPRGQHTFRVVYDVDYLPSQFTVDIDPNSTHLDLFLPQAATCRYYPADIDDGGRTSFCTPGVKRNILNFAGTENLICAANDFGEFCSTLPDEQQLGGTWPAQVINQYIAHAKLLVAATVPAGATTQSLAMSLYNPGDYSPRFRLRPITPTDSSRYQNEVWTDARHTPFYYAAGAIPHTPLAVGDRENANFGLSVMNTYYLNPAYKDAIFIKFDVKNISADPDYRRVNPEVPAAGQTITNIFLTPFVDASLGIDNQLTPGEIGDDNATLFPAENLLAAYDQNFLVVLPQTGGGTTNNTSPGLVGFEFLRGPAGATPRAVIIDRADSLSFTTTALEQATHRLLAAGRAGDQTGCTLRTPSGGGPEAYVCAPETANDVLMGWSVGPIASLAPGESVSLTVVLFVAAPSAGTFVSGTGIAPQNDQIGVDTRPIAQVAGTLRLQAQQMKNVVVP